MGIPEPGTLMRLPGFEARPTSISASLPNIAGRSGNYGAGGGRIMGARLQYDHLAAYAWWSLASPEDRYRSSIQETAGDILRGVSAVDVSASEAYPVLQRGVGDSVDFYPATQWGRATHKLTVTRQLAEEHTKAYQYGTMLGRLSRTNPPQILVDAQEVISKNSMTAQEALTYVLTQWKATHPWLDWEPIPKLELGILDSEGKWVEPNTRALALLQNEDRPRSMRDMLDEFLSIFSGYLLRANSSGKLELIPPPWATDARAPLMVSNHDVYDLSRTADRDYESIINQATVRVKPWGYQPGQPVMQPAEFSVTGWSEGDEAAEVKEIDPTYSATSEGIWLGADQRGEATLTPEWPPLEGLLVGTDAVHLDVKLKGRFGWQRQPFATIERGISPLTLYSGSDTTEYQVVEVGEEASQGAIQLEVLPLVYALPVGRRIAFERGAVRVSEAAEAGAETLKVDALPMGLSVAERGDTSSLALSLDGKEHLVLSTRWYEDQKSRTYETKLWARSAGDGNIQLRWEGKNGLRYEWGSGGVIRLAILATLDGVGQVWQQDRITYGATFGTVTDDLENDDIKLPGVAASQSAHGIREATINASFFSPTLEEAGQIAQAFVAANLSPIERFEVEQGPRLPVYPDDMNRMVILSNGVTGQVEAWEYSDSFAAGGVSMRSGFTLVRSAPQGGSATGVSISPGDREVELGGITLLTALVTGEGAYDHSITWSSSSPGVATVDSNGTATGVSLGTTIITAASAMNPSITDTTTITVILEPPEE